MEKYIKEVITSMQKYLDNEQLQRLENIMLIKSDNYELKEKTYEVALSPDGWEYILSIYLGCKKLENCSEGTINQYKYIIRNMYTEIGKEINQLTANDLRIYLAKYIETKNLSISYREQLRRVLSAFFSWACLEGYIETDIGKKINRIKVPKLIKQPFTDEQRLILIDNAKNIRDKAIMAVLYSTACRVGELVSINRDDIEYLGNKGKIVIYGQKGKAERVVYITEESMYYLKQYLNTRTDDNSALFINSRNRRMSKRSIEMMLKEIGDKCNIHAHPHKFRRTLLTDMNKRGANVQDIKEYAGHVKIDTTMGYVSINGDQVKNTFDRCFN